MEQHQKNAHEIADFLERNSKILKVIYPGLNSHPQFELAKKQFFGFSGMIGVYINGGMKETKLFLKSLKLFALAESLGGVESLIEHPAIMTHASIPIDDRQKIGITDNFVRLSVGIEYLPDLLNDINEALSKI
jgi:cystathionine gamma-lyase